MSHNKLILPSHEALFFQLNETLWEICRERHLRGKQWTSKTLASHVGPKRLAGEVMRVAVDEAKHRQNEKSDAI